MSISSKQKVTNLFIHHRGVCTAICSTPCTIRQVEVHSEFHPCILTCSTMRNFSRWFTHFVIFMLPKFTFIGLNRRLNAPFQFLHLVCVYGSPESARRRSAIWVEPYLESAVFARSYFRCHELHSPTLWFKSSLGSLVANNKWFHHQSSQYSHDQTLNHIDASPVRISMVVNGQLANC